MTAPEPKPRFLPGDTAFRRGGYGCYHLVKVIGVVPGRVAGQHRWTVHTEGAHRWESSTTTELFATLAEGKVVDLREQLSSAEAALEDSLALARELRARVTARTVSLRLACEELAAEQVASDDGGAP